MDTPTPQPTVPTANPARNALIEWHSAFDATVRQVTKQNPSAMEEAFRDRYAHDAAAFVRDCFRFYKGEKPAAYQLRALDLLMEKRRLAVRSLHGTGKSTLAAFVCVWACFTAEDVKVPTTASVWRQLEKYLWPEIHKWMKRFRWDVAGIKPMSDTALLTMSLKLSPTREAFAVASDKHEFIEGAHAKRVVYIFDESKAIPPATWDAAEGAFTGGEGGCEAYALAISTPGEPAGRFYDICSHKRGFEDWATMHVTLEEAIAAGRVSKAWAEQRKLQWGEKSPTYQNRVLGNFAASDEDGVIPLAWIEAANERWQAWKDAGGVLPDGPPRLGVDVARSGDNKTVLASLFGDIITELIEYEKRDTMETTGYVAAFLSAHGGQAAVDVVGVGSGVVDRLREQGFDVYAFNAGESTDETDRTGELGFVNSRSAALWKLRESLDPAFEPTLALPPNDLLTGDLTAPHWKMTSGGKIAIESKDEIKKRIGRSTDHGDAVCMALYRPVEITEYAESTVRIME